MRRLELRPLRAGDAALRPIFPLAAFMALIMFGAAEATAYAPRDTPVKNPDNGHYYEWHPFLLSLNADVTFATASAAAAAKSYQGVPGHLVTITSKAEQDFLARTFPTGFPMWIGASDAAVEGEWRWVAGPEAGELFFRTEEITRSPFAIVGTAFGFESWTRFQSGAYYEPNNTERTDVRPKGSGEDFAVFTLRRPSADGYDQFSALWNDLPGDWPYELDDWDGDTWSSTRFLSRRVRRSS
jgi:hypothetical protein